ncbi:MAG: hypothetical protein QOK37_2595 [Thermoanaerobaculia bacterium]|jgi:hypothetical protein|nr:hypothetical protein [Thermoanaerobaculia bacterium]
MNESTKPATLLHVHPDPQHGRDAFDDDILDLRPVDPRAVEFMKLSRRVCLIHRKRGMSATGVLVGPDLMLTSAHALLGTSTIFADPDDVTVLFDQFIWNRKKQTRAKGDSCGLRHIPFTRQPDVVASSIKVNSRCTRRFDDNELDYILVRLDRPMGLTFLPYSHRIRGWNNCSRADAPAAGRVFVVQHPQGDLLQFAEGYIPANYHVPDFPHLFRYKTITLNGSSGAPVFDEKRRVVGIHIGERSRSDQLGVSFQKIFEDLEKEGVKLPPFRLSKEVMDSVFGSSEIERKRHRGNDWRGDRLFDDIDYD